MSNFVPDVEYGQEVVVLQKKYDNTQYDGYGNPLVVTTSSHYRGDVVPYHLTLPYQSTTGKEAFGAVINRNFLVILPDWAVVGVDDIINLHRSCEGGEIAFAIRKMAEYHGCKELIVASTSEVIGQKYK